MAFDLSGKGASSRKRLRTYRLEFHADAEGVGEVVEFYAASCAYAFKLIRKDARCRQVDVWENGVLVCAIRHGDKGIKIKRSTRQDPENDHSSRSPHSDPIPQCSPDYGAA
jgi:hypothetical protein